VPAYSGYIKKAHMAADYTLVSDVSKALQLQYYSNPNAGIAAYVVLGTENSYTVGEEAPISLSAAEGTGNPDAAAAEFANKAMTAVFGEGWKNTVKLEYGEWSDNGMMDYVMQHTDSADLIATSTFLTTATPDALMGAVTNLTNSASTLIKNYGGDVEAKLTNLCGSDFVTALNNTGVTSGSDDYETVISNMLVGHFAGVLNNTTVDDVLESGDPITQMAMQYAMVYAYCETIGDTETINGLNEHLAASTDMDDLTVSGINSYLTANTSEDFINGYVEFAGDPTTGEGQGYHDMSAALEIMGAVSFVAGTYTDAATLSDPQLYASASVGEQLNNYINAIRAVANLSDTAAAALSDLPAGAVAVFIDAYGNVSAVPGTVYLAG